MARPRIIVAPHFRSMDEIFRHAALDELASFADLEWARDELVPQDVFERELDTASAVVFGTWAYGDALRGSGDGLRAVLEGAGGHNHPDVGYSEILERCVALGSCAHRAGAVPDALLAIGDLVVNDLRAILLGEGERMTMQHLTPERLAALVLQEPGAPG